jgi:integral membrane protein
MTKNQNDIARFKVIAKLEGISFLLLLFIAMPLKYGMDMPLAVKYVGWAHGLLFVLYILLLIVVSVNHDWKIKKIFLAFVAALLPFGPFYFDKKYL